VKARSRCFIHGRSSLTSRAAFWPLPTIPSSGWRLPSSASVAANRDRLEFIRREFERGARELSREEFRERLVHLLAEQFPDETLESLAVSPDPPIAERSSHLLRLFSRDRFAAGFADRLSGRAGAAVPSGYRRSLERAFTGNSRSCA